MSPTARRDMAAASQPSAAQSRFSNFDLLRLIAAGSVVLSHSFGIVLGNEDTEPLVMLLGRGNILGLYGVYTFFIISGFLITASFQHSSLADYVVKRCLRIFPGLVACALVTTVIALVASGGFARWDALSEGAHYIAKTVLLFDTSNVALPGIVFSPNDFGRIFNGSLWSLGPEFLCYIGVAGLGIAALLGLRAALLLLAIGLYTHSAGLLGQIGFVLPFFAAGAVLHFWPRRPVLGVGSFVCAVAGLVLGGLAGHASLAFALFGSWLIIAVATCPVQIGGATRFGDLSYGIYLYGWPVEQTLRYLMGPDATWWLVFLLALPLSALAAFLSWHLVERPSIRFGKSAKLDALRASINSMTERADPIPPPPHALLKPRMFADGEGWCCLYGEDRFNGVAGFGPTPAAAAAAFDSAWLHGRSAGAAGVKQPLPYLPKVAAASGG